MSDFVVRDPDYDARIRRSFARQSFMGLMGVELCHIAPGAVDLKVAARSDLEQQHGFFHAGVTSSVADSAAGYAALSLFEAGAGVLTVEFKINLLAPGQGDALLARGRVVKSGRTLTLAKADVFALQEDAETPVATGLFTMIQKQGLAD
ncbi:PaaI family thioesterase [Coralliovum pocilloporae]|uniref:PaaI family thioesterase n=1 Tax=Coralliovum pocilloporae TaxID=3066369 RepID=UPI003306DE58